MLLTASAIAIIPGMSLHTLPAPLEPASFGEVIEESRIFAKITRILVPFMFLLYVVAALGIWGTLGTFWTLPTSFLRGSAAAGGIAIVNSLGCLSGFVAPYAIGLSRERSGGFAAGLIGVGFTVLCGGLLVLCVPLHEGEDK